MTYEEATILVTMHYILTLFFIGKRYFFSFKHTVFLIICLLINMSLIVLLHNKYLIIFFLLIYLIEWIVSSRYMNNKLLPLLFLFLKYSLSITTFYITFDFQKITKLGNVIPPIQLFFIQACTISVLIFITIRISEKYNLFKKLYLSKKSYGKTSFFLFLLLIVMLISNSLITNSNYFTLILFIVLAVIVVLIIVVLTLLVVSKTNKLNTDNFILKRTLESQQELYDFSREFQHDLKSLLIGIDSYLSENNIEEARLLLHKIGKEGQNTINQQYISQLSAINNLPIKASFYQFAATCEEKKIPFRLNITTDFKDISVEIIDFSRCLSIMLNNALEAKLPGKENFFIHIDILKTEDSTNIIIKNPIGENFELLSIFQKGYSTKTQHKGIGLSNLRKIVNKNKKLKLQYSLDINILIAELIILD